MSTRSVLVVESEPRLRTLLATWLSRAGYEVLSCPGPQAPDYVCIAGRGGSCPLHAAADAVVLDLSLAGDEELVGMPAWQLLLHYTGAGTPVTVLTGPEDPVRPLPDVDIAVLPRQPSRAELLEAVYRILKGIPERRGAVR